MRFSWTNILIGLATTLGVVLVGRKVLAMRASPASRAHSDILPAPDCHEIPASIHGGHRDTSSLKWIVLHSTEGGSSAENIGNYFAQEPHDVTVPDPRDPSKTIIVRQPGGSTNVIVGEDGCVRAVADDVIPAGAPPLNERGLHIEFVGYAKWSRDEWLAHMDTLEAGRRIVRDWSIMYGIPRVFLGSADLQAGLSGVTTHAAVTAAFHKTDHVDPGPDFPIDFVLGDGS